MTHLLPENQEKNASDDYILLHPGAAQYIWFPDVYIGQFFVTCTILLVITVKKKIIQTTHVDPCAVQARDLLIDCLTSWW